MTRTKLLITFLFAFLGLLSAQPAFADHSSSTEVANSNSYAVYEECTYPSATYSSGNDTDTCTYFINADIDREEEVTSTETQAVTLSAGDWDCSTSSHDGPFKGSTWNSAKCTYTQTSYSCTAVSAPSFWSIETSTFLTGSNNCMTYISKSNGTNTSAHTCPSTWLFSSATVTPAPNPKTTCYKVTSANSTTSTFASNAYATAPSGVTCTQTASPSSSNSYFRTYSCTEQVSVTSTVSIDSVMTPAECSAALPLALTYWTVSESPDRCFGTQTNNNTSLAYNDCQPLSGWVYVAGDGTDTCYFEQTLEHEEATVPTTPEPDTTENAPFVPCQFPDKTMYSNTDWRCVPTECSVEGLSALTAYDSDCQEPEELPSVDLTATHSDDVE